MVSTFQARGGHGSFGLARNVGVRFLLVRGESLVPVKRKTLVGSQDRIVAAYVNAVDEGVVHLLAFAIDGKGELHWLYPEYVDPRTDPEGIRLQVGTEEIVFAESVQLEDVASGPMRLVSLISSQQLKVSDVEQLPREERTLVRMKRRWPAAQIDAVEVMWVQ